MVTEAACLCNGEFIISSFHIICKSDIKIRILFLLGSYFLLLLQHDIIIPAESYSLFPGYPLFMVFTVLFTLVLVQGSVEEINLIFGTI